MYFWEMFGVQPGQKQVMTNLEAISLQIVAYFWEVMPSFLALISMKTFLQQHTLPAVQIEQELKAYLNAEADLARIQPDRGSVAASVLLSHLHNLALSETIEARCSTNTEHAISEVIGFCGKAWSLNRSIHRAVLQTHWLSRLHLKTGGRLSD